MPKRFSYRLKTFPYSSHQQISQLLSEIKPQTILDLGCGEGHIGSLLNYQPKKLIGVDKEYYKDLINYTNFYQENLDQNTLKFLLNQKFEAIILADILEHLKSPEKLLKNCLKFLDNKGIIIISIPNTSYWLVRLLYFFKIRPKLNQTIFDKTHLHDFNLNISLQLLSKNKLSKIDLKVTAIPLPLLGKMFNKRGVAYFFYQFNYKLAQIWPNLFAYQLIITAKKNK